MITHKIEATFVLTVLLILVAGHGDYYPVKCVQREMQALLKFKAELSDVDGHGLLSSWENGTDCCQWEGVLCDNRTNHVFGLDLSGFQSLEGKTFSESLVELDELRHLDLSFIDFKGAQIPEFVGLLGKLRYLNLSNCGLGGSVPHSLGNMSSLQFLDLSHNVHTDPYNSKSPINTQPVQISRSSNLEWLSGLQSLKYLQLSYLDLSEADTWPQQINNLPLLQQIHFQGSSLPFPSALPISSLNYLPNSSNSLLVLDISRNYMNLSSVFPWLLTHKNTLSYLDLSKNYNEGGIPDALKNFKNLSYLDLSYNGLQGNILDALGNLPLSVSHLNLANNSLKGNIDDTLRNLPPTVSYLDLSSTDLDAAIPNQRTLPHLRDKLLGQRYWSNLTFLNLSNNKLQGELTHLVTLLWDHTFLQHLDLSGNNLFGSWPNMSRFQILAHLDLQDNYLNGSIGEDCLRLPNLEFLYLSGNNLSGSIPNLSTCSSLRELWLNNGNKFSGKLTESIGSLGKLEYLNLESNHLEGLISDVHFLNLSNLQYLDLSFNSNLTIRMNPSWTPPFQLDCLFLTGCTLGPQFPPWLRNQTQISFLDISHAGINDTIPNWFQNNSRLLMEINMSYNQMHGPFPDLSSAIYSLDLRFNEFNGTLPPIMMPIPTSIYLLYLSNNKFSGNINNFVLPEHLGALDLSNNQLSGQISQDCWDHLLNVSFVNLANNNLSGSFPTNITYCSISSLLLRNNRFTGNIPTSMAICSRLYVLDLSNNQLSGQISQIFWNFLMQVEYLNLADNNLSGNIRTNITQCGIRSLRLRNNSFVGQIPHSLAKCRDLFDLDIGENSITGSVPYWLGDRIPFLRLLSLRSNKLDGNLPSSLCKLSSIQLLDISRNNISGTIPKCVNNFTGMTSKSTTPDIVSDDSDAVSLINAKLIWKGHIVEYNTTIWLMKLLDLSENNLAGEIPHEVTSLVELVSLNLSSNHLVGSIPPNISNLKILDSLDLSRNNLTGGIPSTLSQLHQLGNLNLSSNKLSGKIPYDAHMDTFSNSSYLENPGLCGPPLSKVCPEDVPRTRKPNFVDETVHEDMFKSREFYISMLLGFIMFFWAVFGCLYINRGWNRGILKAFTAVDDWLYVKIRVNKRRVERYFQK